MKQFAALLAVTLAFASGAVANTQCTPETAQAMDQLYDPAQHMDLLSWVEQTQQTQAKAKRANFECQGTDICLTYQEYLFCGNPTTKDLTFPDGSTVNVESGKFEKANGETGNVKDAAASPEAASPPPPGDAPPAPTDEESPGNTEPEVETSTNEPTTTAGETDTQLGTQTPTEGAAAGRMAPAELSWGLLALVGLLAI